VSKIESGKRQVKDVDLLRQIAHRLNIPPSQLGLAPDAGAVPAPSSEAAVGAVDVVGESQAEWRRVRRYLNRHRSDLARLALGLYRPELRVGSSPLMAPEGWVPAEPVPLGRVSHVWVEEPPRPAVVGTESEGRAVLPLRAPGRAYDRYTAAIRYVEPPSLFENRASYRLLDVELSGDSGRMAFGLSTYFDKLDLTEAVAHELAAADKRRRECGGDPPGWAELPLRSLVGDPFDLERRAVLPAVETLTLRRSRSTGHANFLLHWRDPAKVATAGGIYGLIPSGEFQPSSIAAWDRSNDFDMWRNMVREFSEELLGTPEHDGARSEPIDYDGWPLYRELCEGRDTGRVAVFCLGLGLDALTLAATVMTVLVIDDDVFDHLLGEAVQVNSEGSLVTSADAASVAEGVPFTEDNVHRMLTQEPMASPGAAILEAAWRHRVALLSH
jgi:hypothetical protein